MIQRTEVARSLYRSVFTHWGIISTMNPQGLVRHDAFCDSYIKFSGRWYIKMGPRMEDGIQVKNKKFSTVRARPQSNIPDSRSRKEKKDEAGKEQEIRKKKRDKRQ